MEKQAPLLELTPEDIAEHREWTETTQFDNLKNQCTGLYVPKILETKGGRQFQVYADVPKDAKHVICFPAEFGNGVNATCEDSDFIVAYRPHLARCALMQYSDEPIGIMYLPNNGHMIDALNLSQDERRTLSSGDLSPLVERLSVSIEYHQNVGRVTLLGVSLGAATSLAALNSPNLPADASAVLIETPHKTTPLDLLRSGGKTNKNRTKSMAERYDLRDNFQVDGPSLIRWSLGVLNPSNIAIAKGLRKFDLNENAEQCPRPITACYGTESYVSSAEAHDTIHNNGNPLQRAYRTPNDHSMHSDLLMILALIKRHEEMLRQAA